MDYLDAREYLGRYNQDFQELSGKHQGYEADLVEFTIRRHLSSTEQIQETELKKRKLALKDQMQSMIKVFLSENGRVVLSGKAVEWQKKAILT
jgi:uncharacterized protein YdcH (DUF465 family)